MAASTLTISSIVSFCSHTHSSGSLQQQQGATIAAVGSLASRNFFGQSVQSPLLFSLKDKGVSQNNSARISLVRAATSSSSQGAVRQFCIEKFRARQGLKVIAGLHNFNADNVAKVVIAAEKGGATHVDIACDADLVRLAATLTSLLICISSIEPEAFVLAVEAGAHMICRCFQVEAGGSRS